MRPAQTIIIFGIAILAARTAQPQVLSMTPAEMHAEAGAITYDAAGNLHVAEGRAGQGRVRKYAPDGTLVFETRAGVLYQPFDVAVAPDGTIYVTDQYAVKRVNADGTVTLLAGSATESAYLDGQGAAARFRNPQGLTVHSTGILYVADAGFTGIRRVTPAGEVTTVARITWCTDCPEYQQQNLDACNPTDVAANSANLLFVAAQCPFGGAIYTLTTGGALSLFTGSPTRLFARDGSPATASIEASGLLTMDSQGNLYTAEDSTSLIRRITASGTIITVGGSLRHYSSNYGIGAYAIFDQPFGIALDPRGPIAVTDRRDNSRVLRGLRATAVGSTVAGRGDFNGDGKPDLLWRNTHTGEVLIWFMNGTTVVSGSAYIPVGLSYALAAVADLDGDGKSDLVWYDHLAGSTDIWLMDGATRRSSRQYVTMASPWDLAGTGDFNGDTRSDLLWRNASSGANLIWYMNGDQVVSGSAYFYVEPNFKVAAVADFDGNDRADIVWYDGIGGVIDIWRMNGHTLLGSRDYNTMAHPWDIVGSADMNGDSRPDLVWRNAQTGAVFTWFVAGGAVTNGSAYVYADKSFTLPTVADFNRDGHSDLVWYDGTRGVIDVWLMNNGDRLVSHQDYGTLRFPWDIFGAR